MATAEEQRKIAAEKRRQEAALKKKNAAKAAREGYIDANLDGVPDPDPVTQENLAAESRIAAGIFYSVPELQPIIEKGATAGWGKEKYILEFQNTDWFKNNSKYAREALAMKAAGGADWDLYMEDARRFVQQRARETGARLDSQTLESMTTRAVMEGWQQRGGTDIIDNALADFVDYQQGIGGRGNQALIGAAGNLENTLRAAATSNGLSYSENFYKEAAQSVMRGLTTEEELQRDIQDQAAGLFPVYADKIKAGMTVRQLASPYLNMMAQELEINPDGVKLDDPYIRSALGGFDKDGNAMPMNLWDFQKKLRSDPRWENTSKAQNEITSVTGRVMQMFGLMGR